MKFPDRLFGDGHAGVGQVVIIRPEPGDIAAVLAGQVKTAGRPAVAIDCHVSIFGPKRRYTPAKNQDTCAVEKFDAPSFQEATSDIEMSGVVLVQPREYGEDHRCMIDAMEQLTIAREGETSLSVRGVGMVAPMIEDSALEDLTAASIVGARLQMTGADPSHDWPSADRLAWRVHDFGWHVELEMNGSDLHEVEQILRDWPGRVVLPHIGLFKRTRTLSQRGFKALTRLIDKDKVWVKLSAPYLSSRKRLREDPEIDEIARALVNWAPERMVWGSNWPHMELEEEKPEGQSIVDQLTNWVPEETRRNRILEANPKILYGLGTD